jgi:acyl transferase domain-containing protein
VTLDEACKAVRNGSAQAALVAGINLIATGATADDLEGEAVVAVFIKPLSDAVRDGNPIQAVIRAASSDSSDAEVVEVSLLSPSRWIVRFEHGRRVCETNSGHAVFRCPYRWELLSA